MGINTSTNLKISVLSPSVCASQELAAFEALVKAGKAVDPYRLDKRILDAFRLLFLRAPDGKLVGVAALKHPDVGYRRKIFHSAGSAISTDDYDTELGWIVVADSHLGQRLPLQLIKHLLPYADGECVYATTSKEAIRYALSDSDFRREGEPFSSERGCEKLDLYVRPS